VSEHGPFEQVGELARLDALAAAGGPSEDVKGEAREAASARTRTAAQMSAIASAAIGVIGVFGAPVREPT
jgi:hypothetical protein